MEDRFRKLLAGDLEWVHRQMEEMMGRPMLSTLARQEVAPGCFLPPTDVFETPDHLLIRMDLPGIDRERVSVVLDAGLLTISGRRSERMTEGVEAIRRHQMEIDYGSFTRKIRIAIPLREGSTKAVYRDGVLEIQIEKAPAFRSVPVGIDAGEERGR